MRQTATSGPEAVGSPFSRDEWQRLYTLADRGLVALAEQRTFMKEQGLKIFHGKHLLPGHTYLEGLRDLIGKKMFPGCKMSKGAYRTEVEVAQWLREAREERDPSAADDGLSAAAFQKANAYLKTTGGACTKIANLGTRASAGSSTGTVTVEEPADASVPRFVEPEYLFPLTMMASAQPYMGHAIYMYVRKEKDRETYSVYVMNAGWGLDYHFQPKMEELRKAANQNLKNPRMVWTGVEVYKLTSVELWAALLEMQHAQAIFKHTTLPKVEGMGSSAKMTPVYMKNDFYAHLIRYLGPDDGRHGDDLGAEFLHRDQRAGTCSWTSAKMVWLQVYESELPKYKMLMLDMELDFTAGVVARMMEGGGQVWAGSGRYRKGPQNPHRIFYPLSFSCCPVRSCLLVCE